MNRGLNKLNLRIASRQLRSAAFTLVEILIVIVILGILATIVIPQFSNASHEARENMLKDDLRYLRTQVQVFKAQHREVSPGYPGGNTSSTPTQNDFVDQMTKFTSEACGTSASPSSTYKFGPYLSGMPKNPLNDLSTMTVVPNGSAIPAPDGSTGWIYRPETQEIIANVTGQDNNGVLYKNY